MIEIETVIDAFNGKITDDLVINSKKGDKLVISDNAWKVIQDKHKKWFKFIKEIKEDKMFVSPKNKMVDYSGAKNK